MDLGIRGKTAIVCAASKGLGRACAVSLARAGVDLVITARGEDALAATAAEIRRDHGVRVVAVPGDITTPEGRDAALRANPAPDILVNNAGGPPPGDFHDWDRDAWMRALEANMLTPIFMIRAVLDAMIARKFGRIVNITSSTVKSPVPLLGLSSGARAGLTGFVSGLARETAKHNVTINNLLPGFFATDRNRATMSALARERGVGFEEIVAQRVRSIPAGRQGEPEEFGEYCAYLCSAQAGFITAQNLLIDGGHYPGTF